MIGMLGDVVCGLHRARGDNKRGVFGEASKPWSTTYQWFGLKTTGTVFSGLTSKPVVTVYSGLASKLGPSGFPVYASKSALAVW
jgi:hypothetical protein